MRCLSLTLIQKDNACTGYVPRYYRKVFLLQKALTCTPLDIKNHFELASSIFSNILYMKQLPVFLKLRTAPYKHKIATGHNSIMNLFKRQKRSFNISDPDSEYKVAIFSVYHVENEKATYLCASTES